MGPPEYWPRRDIENEPPPPRLSILRPKPLGHVWLASRRARLRDHPRLRQALLYRSFGAMEGDEVQVRLTRQNVCPPSSNGPRNPKR